MTQEQHPPAWLELRIEETEGVGVEASKLSKLLQDLSGALYAIARARLGTDAARRGPRTAVEESLAAIRVVKLSPGSAVIEVEPPTQAQLLLNLPESASPDAIVTDFVSEAQRIERKQRSAFSRRPEVRRHVNTVLRDAGEIGKSTEVIVRPKTSQLNEVRVRLAAEPAADVESDVQRQPRRRRLTGHAYMVDVEPGRLRVRLKLPDGRDMTLDASPELIDRLKAAVDEAVEIEAIEDMEGDQVAARTALNLALLPSSGPGSTRPPKSVEELAREQGIDADRPDYQALASAVWETEEQIEEFEEYLRQVRRASA